MKIKMFLAAALAVVFVVCGSLLAACGKGKGVTPQTSIPTEQLPQEAPPLTEAPAIQPPAPEPTETQTPSTTAPSEGGNQGVTTVTTPTTPPAELTPPVTNETRAQYIRINTDGVNLRKGGGTGYAVLGKAEKNTLFALCGKTGSWYKTYYKNGYAYISASYCTTVHMDKSADARIEKVIDEGCKTMGVEYVYGATRYHDGSGKRLSGFSPLKFDCSSLMQYAFKLGANVNLQLTTRTQIKQGNTVKSLKRGDLLFFTNASRCNNTGIERVGHVALYLGDNYILHTASDYAKIEQISSARWGYYIQAQRMLTL